MARSRISISLDLAAWSFLLWVLYRKVSFYFFPYKQSLTRYRRNPQAYAIITGASAGIGYGYAQELVAQGFGVILIASRKERLEAAAQKLRQETPNAVVKTIVWNAKDVDSEALTTALKPVLDLPITVLVNNVASLPIAGYRHPLTEYSAQDVMDTMNINATFMAQLTRIMIPTLSRNGRSVVINMGSGADCGSPWMLIYGASKGFVQSFAVGLARESRAFGWKIDSLYTRVGDVYSEFNPTGLPPGTPTSRQYAKCVLDRVEMAVDRKTWVITPHWFHVLELAMFDLLPEDVVQKIWTFAMQSQIKMKSHEKEQ